MTDTINVPRELLERVDEALCDCLGDDDPLLEDLRACTSTPAPALPPLCHPAGASHDQLAELELAERFSNEIG